MGKRKCILNSQLSSSTFTLDIADKWPIQVLIQKQLIQVYTEYHKSDSCHSRPAVLLEDLHEEMNRTATILTLLLTHQ